MVLDGFVSLQESLVQAKPKHPPKLEGLQRRESGSLGSAITDVKKVHNQTQYHVGLAIFTLAILLLLFLRARRSKLSIQNASRLVSGTSRKSQTECLPV